MSQSQSQNNTTEQQRNSRRPSKRPTVNPLLGLKYYDQEKTSKISDGYLKSPPPPPVPTATDPMRTTKVPIANSRSGTNLDQQQRTPNAKNTSYPPSRENYAQNTSKVSTPQGSRRTYPSSEMYKTDDTLQNTLKDRNSQSETPVAEDSISAITEEKTSSSILSVLAQAKMILTGQNPAGNSEDPETMDDNVIGFTVPVRDRIDAFEKGNLQNATTEPEIDVPATSSRVSWRLPANTLNGLPNSTLSSNDLYHSATSVIDFIDFEHDDVHDMTWSRRIALYLINKPWYNPALKKQHQKVNESDDPDAVLQLTRSTDSNGSTRMQILNESNKREVLLNDAYPFTQSLQEQPSLARAWAYFEHVTLPRYIFEPKGADYQRKNIFMRFVRKFMKANKQLRRAEPGECNLPTKLYKPIFTPHKQLGDFGLGIGLYFATLRALMVLTLLAGALNFLNFRYFHSAAYSNPDNPSALNSTLRLLVEGSAICTDTSWVLCADCVNHTEKFPDRILMTALNINSSANLSDAAFVLRNNCVGATIQQGMISFATLLFVMLGTIALNVYLTRMEVAFDEDEQTAQDYSIIIENPPPDATDPQEWHNFFKKSFGAHVTACTVAVDNDLLVRSLVRRRELLRKIEMLVEPGTSLDFLTLARIALKQERERRLLGHCIAFFSPGVPEFFSQLTVMTGKLQGLAQQHYPAMTVFISFETEKAQRDVLMAYSLGSLDIKRNNSSKLKDPKRQLFRGNLVLQVSEPDEPSTVRWQDLNEKFIDRIKQQCLTGLCTVVAIVLTAFIIFLINVSKFGKQATAYTIAIFNVIFPEFAKLLTNLEAHSSEGDKQRSLYFKIALFRWVNTAVVITLTTPFTATLSNKALIDQVAALFFAEITTTVAIQFLDPMGHIQRHILAPRAATQDAMNLLMRGAEYELAERYTNMTKILFLALWYCAIYPGALFLCSLSLLIMYFMDRFSLMRSWKRAPQLGSKISQFSRRYFFSLAIVAMAIMSSYYWACFPYDNLCESDIPINSTYSGSWSIPGQSESVLVNETSTWHTYCEQDFFQIMFPFVPSFQPIGHEWMTDEQEVISNIHGWSAIAVTFLILFSYVWKFCLNLMSMCRGTYKPCGNDMGINFSDVPSINSYVPQVHSSVFSYPLLASNIDNIDTDLLDWTDPDRPHSYYDLTKDAEVLLKGREFGNNVVFSQIKHWPPPGKMKVTPSKRVEAFNERNHSNVNRKM